jgi:hypothetical protein
MGIKVPVYISERELPKASSGGLSGGTTVAEAMQPWNAAANMFGDAVTLLGRAMAHETAENKQAEREALAEQRRRDAARDELNILTHYTRNLEYYNDDLTKSFEQEEDNPEGFAGRFMTKFRENMDTQFNEFQDQNSDYAVAWATKHLQLDNALYGKAIELETRGKIAKQDANVQESVQNISNAYRMKGGTLENMHTDIAQFERTIKNMPYWSTEHKTKVSEHMQQEIAVSYIKGLLDKKDITGAETLIKDPTFYKYIKPESLDTLMNQVKAVKEKHDAVAAHNAGEVWDSHVTAILERGTGNPNINREQMKKDMGDAQWADAVSKEQKAYTFAKAKSGLEPLPVTKWESYVETLKPLDTSDKRFNEKQWVYNTMQNYVRTELAELHKDPAGYAARKMEDVGRFGKKGAYVYDYPFNAEVAGQGAIDQPLEVLGEEVRTYIDNISAFAEKKGMPLDGRYFPNAIIERDSKALQTMPADKVADFLTGQQKIWGKHFEQYWKEMSAYGKVPTEYKVSLFAQGTVHEALINNAVRLKREDLTKIFPKEGDFTQLHEAVVSQLQPFLKAINLGAQSGVAQRDVADLAYVLTKAAGIKYGSATTKDSVNGIAKKIVNEIVMDRFHFARTYVIPRELIVDKGKVIVDEAQASRIKQGLDKYLTEDGMKSKGFVPLVTGAQPGTTNEFNTRTLMRSYAADGYWVTNEDFTGVYLKYKYRGSDDYVLDSNWRRYEIKFKDILYDTTVKGQGKFDKPMIPGITTRR